jgi:hypothetical protein
VRDTGVLECPVTSDDKLDAYPVGTYTDVAIYNEGACAVSTEGELKCWGRAVDAAPFSGVKDIELGIGFGCYIDDTDGVDCTDDDNGLDEYPRDEGYQALTTGPEHACALTDQQKVKCWGNYQEKIAWNPPGEFSSIDAGYRHTCGIRPDGSVFCWGDNGEGQSFSPSTVATDIRVGPATCVTLKQGRVRCFGALENESGQPPSDSGYQYAVSGIPYRCGLRTDGSVECWGDQFSDRLDAPDVTFESIEAATYHTCGLTPSGEIRCWGSLGSGQGDAPNEAFEAMTTGRQFTCGLKQDGSVSCWGDGFDVEPNPSNPPGGSTTPVG